MNLGMIGLGRMGSNMARRLMGDGHRLHVFDLNPAAVAELGKQGAVGSASIGELARALPRPRAVWLMVPAGEPTEKSVLEASRHLERGDILIDGGNSHFKDDLRRAGLLAPLGIEYMDVGTSGGIWGIERGYCLMAGGSGAAFSQVEPILRSLAPGRMGIEPVPRPGTREEAGKGARQEGTACLGYLHCGPVGAGHFVKMIHNGIEYGMMQALAEGFDILRNAGSPELPRERRYELDLAAVSELWRRGSVVSSWLLDLIARALAEDAALDGYTGFVQDSGEGRWTLEAALEESVPADVIAASLFTRFRSRHEHTFAEKMLSAMRRQFGGHLERPEQGRGGGAADGARAGTGAGKAAI